MKIVARYSHGKYIMLTFSNGKRILEHRYVIQEKICRKLKLNEVIHHIDHNGKNNNISNLQILSPEEHSRLHRKERNISYVLIKCPQCNKNYKKEERRVKYRLKQGQKVFCSRKCSGKFGSYLYWKIDESAKGRQSGLEPVNLGSSPSSSAMP